MDNGETSFWAAKAVMAAQLTEDEKRLREQFVEQYMLDFSPTFAAVRCGFPGSFAGEWATRFMDEPYTRQLIAERMRQISDDPKVEEAETKRIIRARLLKEAHYNGPGASHAARVSALSQLKNMYRMDAPLKVETTNRGGVMQVPNIAGQDDWEEAAQASQEALRKASEV